MRSWIVGALAAMAIFIGAGAYNSAGASLASTKRSLSSAGQAGRWREANRHRRNTALGRALGLTRLMASLLYGASVTDAMTFARISALLVVVSMLACLIPVRRAPRVDPIIAPRYD